MIVIKIHRFDSKCSQRWIVVRKKPKRRITITLEEDTFENISNMATENDLSIARVIRYAVDNLLKERNQGQHQQLLLPLSKQKNYSTY
jgi:predicted DNA-binding ribbon-helix-helix protein